MKITRQAIFSVGALTVVALLAVGCGNKPEPKAAEAAKPAQTTAKAEAPRQQPKDWIIVDETEYIPVIDDLSEHLNASRKAFVANDWKGSAVALRAAADRLEKEAAGLSRRDKAKEISAAKSLRDLATTVEAGKVSSVKTLDAAIAKAHRADLERDWLVEDATSWYPFVDEPNTHFQAAHDSFLSKEYKKASEEIRKGTAFVVKEEGSAIAKAKQDLGASERELQRLAREVEQGSVQDVKRLDNAFARAEGALALSHRIKANEAWDKKELTKIESELKAGATHVENAASWVGTEAKAAAETAIRDTRSVAAKLTEGTGYATEEVGKAIDSLGKAIDDLGHKIAPANK